jgi:hypothetical protein
MQVVVIGWGSFAGNECELMAPQLFSKAWWWSSVSYIKHEKDLGALVYLNRTSTNVKCTHGWDLQSVTLNMKKFYVHLYISMGHQQAGVAESPLLQLVFWTQNWLLRLILTNNFSSVSNLPALEWTCIWFWMTCLLPKKIHEKTTEGLILPGKH